MATLELTSLHCTRRRDLEGFDEPQIVVNKKVVWNGAIKKGETLNLAPTAVDFEEVATVTLNELNGSKAKQIGSSVTVDPVHPAAQPLVFKTSGTYYELYFQLKADVPA